VIRSNRDESSPLLSTRHTGSRFARDLENIAYLGFEGGSKMLSNRDELCLLLSIRHTGSRFARDLENIAHLGSEGGLKMLSIRRDSIES